MTTWAQIHATTAMKSILKKVDSLSHNIANIDTPGYKRRGTAFSELLRVNLTDFPVEQRLTPHGIRVGAGARIGMTRLDLAQGSPKHTGVPTDFMIDGRGFFLVERDGQLFLTRDGHFLRTPDGFLVTAQGDYVLNQNRERATDEVAVFDVDNPDKYQAVGDNRLLVENGDELILREDAKVLEGYVEASNVDLLREMTELIMAQRSLQMNARALTINSQLGEITNQIYRG